MKISKQSRLDARRLLRACVVNGAMDDNRVRQAVQAVIRDKPRGYLPVLSHFQRLVRLEIARRTARVESAAALPPPAQAQVQADLGRRYGSGLDFIFTQNAALLGGMRIQVGGDVYDGSVQGRLAELQERF